MTGKDKDYRYMATSDLLNELNKDSFRAEPDLEAKLMNSVLQQLNDAAGDVSGLAVKWCLFDHFSVFLFVVYVLR
jgi:cullin-associated NEDD8-dissociated protein 1